MSEVSTPRRSPVAWVPTLYFAEGLPFYAVNYMALLFYQGIGIDNAKTAFVVSMLAWPWTLKPVWSPLLEMYRTKKFFVVLMQLLGGAGLLLLALALPLPGAFAWSIAILTLVAFASSTHDIAADGVYIASLSPKEQAAYAGWCGAFYNVARIFSMGGLIALAGLLQARFADAGAEGPVVRAWMVIFAGLGAILVALAAWHARVLPTGGESRRSESLRQVAATFWDVLVTFFRKRNVLLLLLFIFLYRAGEGQVIKVGPLFLQADRASGGLGLSLQEFGTIYGTFGSAAFILGSVLGGYFVSWLGLKRALLPLVLVLNVPMLAYWYLAVALPTSPVAVTIALSVEMFGYGFGFVGVILLIMQEIAPGPYQTAHYAIGGALMNLGVILPGAVSGFVQQKLGYPGFFLWVLASAVPAIAMARFLPIGRGAGSPEDARGGRGGET
jgi:PAT family beta-lactamase induction signal transducer AmpG